MTEKLHQEGPAPEQPRQGSRRVPALVLIFMLVLAAACWLLLDKLTEISRIQDCVMQGRKNCAPIEPAPEK